MSLREKLKPQPKKPGVGKRVDCPRCGCSDAEHYSANYIACPRCDKKAAPVEKADPADTNPMWPFDPGTWTLPAGIQPTIEHARTYTCALGNKSDHFPSDVAAGERCRCCGRSLYLVVP
jgi:hypothetical protein